MTTASDDQLEALDRELLNAVQWDFPLEPRPFAVLGERLGIGEEAVRERIARVKELGVLRQLSAIFDTRALGYGSALVAAQIDPDRVDEAAAVVSAHPGVSHNYKRNHAYNLWYTIAVPPGESLEDHIDVLHRESGAIVTRKLPTLKLYKIGVKLDMTGATAADAKAEVLEHEKPERREHMDAPELSDLEVAAIRVVQEDLPLVEHPFAAYGELIGCDEATVLELLRSFKERKLMRRFAAVMNHRSAGFKANAMGVWAVPDAQLDEIGPQMAGFALVSHCYRRPTYDDWPYSIFTMVHGKNAKDCEATIAAIHDETGVDEFALLWSIKEYKKTRVRYYTDDWDEWRGTHLTPSLIDVDAARADTPGCRDVVHLNNAGAALPPRVVVDTVIDHLELEARVGGYAAADAVSERSAAVYASVASLVGAAPAEIALVESATRAWDMAFYALARSFKTGDRILTSRAEYASNVIAFLQVARQTGARVEVVPDDDSGQLSVDALRAQLDDRVRLVAISWIPTQSGLVNPAAAVGAVTRAAGVPYLLDACQAAGQLAIDVDALQCDFLSVTGRKYLRGPRGTGFLYVRRSWLDALEPPFLDVHAAQWGPGDALTMRADARRFESWEHSVANRLGLGAAVDYALALGADAIARRVRELADSLRLQLASVPGLTLHDPGVDRCGIVTFTIDGVDVYELAARLRTEAINISVSTIDFARYDFEARGLAAVARASVHYYNTDDELVRLVDALRS